MRTTPLLYVADGERWVVAASNAGDDRPPAWWLNLQARPETTVDLADGDDPSGGDPDVGTTSRAAGAVDHGDAATVELTDGTTGEFAGPTIFVGVDDAWYVPVKDGRFEARLGRGAMVHLADYLEEDDAEPEGVVLRLPEGLRIGFAPRDA